MSDINVAIYTVAGFIKERELTLTNLKERKEVIDASIPELEKGLEEERARLARLVKEKEEQKKE